ncbi:hypothetical protein DESC_370108 [Desulfosarcina cetonica]|uniref:helix-turn-helix domain-containing protein n=1 Tax=Desulfosarcina cetonica TaxID=90730 RepID=UPI0006CF8AB8|nr:helix-turn-helix domain-containing protein [Desulfosarcina cetonica]VTR65739.1 hypothetical protein DESC_370108 [Desulfosarcina cetonica]
MSSNYKKVPAIEKCFAILTLMAESKRPFRFFEIVKRLDMNKSTVFNILHTLHELDVLRRGEDGLFRLGPKLCYLGKAAAGENEARPLRQTVPQSSDCELPTTPLTAELFGPLMGCYGPEDQDFRDQDTLQMLFENSAAFRQMWEVYVHTTA